MSKKLALSLSLLSLLSACGTEPTLNPSEALIEETPAAIVFSRDTAVLQASSELSPGPAYNAIDDDSSSPWCPIEGDLTRSLTFMTPEGFEFDETNNTVTMTPGFTDSDTLIQSMQVWYDGVLIDLLSFENSPRPQENDLPIGPVDQITFQIADEYVIGDNASTLPCIPEINFPGFWGEQGI